MPNAKRLLLPPNSPARWPRKLPAGAALWDPAKTRWNERNTDGLFTCELIEATLRLTKGRRRGELVRLRHWQGDLVCDILRLRRDGVRMYRTYEVFIARKNGKSLLGAGLALDGLFDEPGAEVYSCAGSKDQARLIFKEVKAAVEMSPELDAKHGGLLTVYRDAIEYAAQGSVYRVLSSDAPLQEGLNPSRVLFDEKHVQPDDELWNVMNQGSGTREQPIVITLTTKGVKTYTDGTDTICFRGYQYAKRLMAGEIHDPYWGARIYETNPKADHRDAANWWKANPSLGDTLLVEDMESKALAMPEADFKTKRLNIWVNHATTFLPEGMWDSLAQPRAVIDGEPAILAFDGSFNNDSTALVAWLLGGQLPYLTLLGLWERPAEAPEGWHVPIAEVEALILGEWHRQVPEDLHRWPTDGRILQPAGLLDVREVVFDPARWTKTMEVLDDDGVPVVSYPNTAERMVPATQRFYEAVVNGLFAHDGHPALARHAANAVARITPKGLMVSKESRNSARKIDAFVCSIFGYDRAAVSQDAGPLVFSLADYLDDEDDPADVSVAA